MVLLTLPSLLAPTSDPAWLSVPFLTHGDANHIRSSRQSPSLVLLVALSAGSAGVASKEKTAMKKYSLRLLGILLFLALAPVALMAQTGQGILFGHWKLNVAKSTFGDGPKLMGMSIDVTSDKPELIQYDVAATAGNGFAYTYSFKGAADGKEYPISGSSSVYSYTEEAGVVHETQKDPDGTITKGDFTVTPNGKVGTWMYTITNPDGTVVKQKLVFDHLA
jgi:hypothetical protein